MHDLHLKLFFMCVYRRWHFRWLIALNVRWQQLHLKDESGRRMMCRSKSISSSCECESPPLPLPLFAVELFLLLLPVDPFECSCLSTTAPLEPFLATIRE